jgi:glycerol-3-phosphate dehydrogenase
MGHPCNVLLNIGHKGSGELAMYDAIVVGARCAGSATALLLARKGYRVLLVDKVTFPSDTISGHFILTREPSV